eukprot:symbB.v1.2.020608.t1/scaffold1743.1/size123518/9
MGISAVLRALQGDFQHEGLPESLEVQTAWPRSRVSASSFLVDPKIPISHDLHEPKAVQVLSCQATGHDVCWQGNMARVVCPAHCEHEPAAVAVGTGVHPLGSPICLGAIVDRVLPVYGGEMMLTKAAPIQAQRVIGQPAGLESYSGGEANVAVSVSATGLKGEARQVSCFASIFHQNFRFCKAWHAYPTDNLDLSPELPPEHVVQAQSPPSGVPCVTPWRLWHTSTFAMTDKTDEVQAAQAAQAMKMVKDLFNKYDENGDHKLSEEELKHILGQLNGGLSSEECDELFCKLDRDHDGNLSVSEFLDYVFDDDSAAGVAIETVDRIKEFAESEQVQQVGNHIFNAYNSELGQELAERACDYVGVDKEKVEYIAGKLGSLASHASDWWS